MITFKCGEIIRLPVKRKQDRVYLASNIASKTRPRDMGNGYSFSTITGILRVKDKVHSIGPCKPPNRHKSNYSYKKRYPPSQEENLQNIKYEFGSFDVNVLIKMLKRNDFTEKIFIERSASSITLKMYNEKVKIKLGENNTEIIYSGKQSTRLKLRDLLLNCLHKF